MSRVLHLKLDEGAVVTRCLSEQVGVSAIKPARRRNAPGVQEQRGAETMRKKLKAHMIKGEVTRARYRPTSPLW